MSKVIVKNVTAGRELLWRSIKIRKSLDEICHTLELEIPPSERQKVGRHNRLQACCRNALDIGFDGERCITTVLVDEVNANADVSKHSVTVFGRSPARDIIDSTWSDLDDDSNMDLDNDPNRTLKTIVQQIAGKFNIICDTFKHEGREDPTDPVSYFAFENESPWTKLIDEADQQGFIFTSNEIGNLYLWRVQAEGNITKPFHITEGVNIKSINWTENGSEQFHEYVVKGGGEEAREIDESCPGKRVLTINITDLYVSEGELERRAKTEMRRRKETRTTVTVSGWGLADEQIKSIGDTNEREIYWIPNTLIPVKVPTLGLNDSLLISEVEYTANAETMSCDITLVKRDMYI
jgi:prophage tail gpP-like protein